MATRTPKTAMKGTISVQSMASTLADSEVYAHVRRAAAGGPLSAVH